MKTTAWIVLMFLSLLCCGGVFADGLQDAVLGAWVSGSDTIEFLGSGVGHENNASGARFFRYSFPAEAVVVLNYGAGAQDTCTVSVASGELTLTLSGQQPKVFALQSALTASCANNRRVIEGAISLYSLDRDGAPLFSIMDLMPEYLPEPPRCPEGGIYALGEQVSCTIAEHNAAP